MTELSADGARRRRRRCIPASSISARRAGRSSTASALRHGGPEPSLLVGAVVVMVVGLRLRAIAAAPDRIPLRGIPLRGLSNGPKIPIMAGYGLGCRASRLRSNPSNLSGSFQRREPLVVGSLLLYANVAIIGAGVVGLRHRLAAGRARRFRHGVRPRRGRRGREPRRRRHAGRLLRGRARRGSAGRARARQPGALAGLCGRTAGGFRHRRGTAHRRHAGDRARPRTTRRGSIITSSSSRSSVCRCNGFRPPRRAGASRISPASSPARSGARRTIRSTTASSPPALRVAAEAAGAIIREHTPVKEIAITAARAERRRAGRWHARSPPTWSCWRPAPGRAASPGWRRNCGRRCGRSRARCCRCAWIRQRR